MQEQTPGPSQDRMRSTQPSSGPSQDRMRSTPWSVTGMVRHPEGTGYPPAGRDETHSATEPSTRARVFQALVTLGTQHWPATVRA